MPEFNISVRGLVETVLTGGHIDNRYVRKNRAVEGTAIHKRLQSKYTTDDLKEVGINAEYIKDGITLRISGRIDGVLSYLKNPIIEEIKSTDASAHDITEANEAHLAQAKIYAYIYATQNGLCEISVRVHYYCIPEKKSVLFNREYNFPELKEFFENICSDYFVYLKFKSQLITDRDKSIEDITFPYEYRKHQKQIISKIKRVQSEGKNLFLSAPTGTGKTIDAIFPSVLYLKGTSDTSVFYLTSKSTQKQVAQDALSLLESRGLQIKSVTITAKEKCCFLETPSCNPDDCPYAVDYYSKLFSAATDILSENGVITREIIEDYAKGAAMCPFELSLDLSVWCDFIICDYNYVFDPAAALKRFFEQTPPKPVHIFLVDEAHNLPDRAREMYSAQIDKKTVLEVKRLFKNQKALANSLGKINKMLLSYKKNEMMPQGSQLPDPFIGALYSFQSTADKLLAQSNGKADNLAKLQDLYFELNAFMRIYELRGNSHNVFYSRESDSLKLFCCDAREYLSEKLRHAKSALFFSATLQPLSFYCELCGGSRSDYLLNAPSIFPKENFRIAIDTSVATSYAKRDANYALIASRIRKLTERNLGNALIFFPSYAFMKSVYKIYDSEYGSCGIIVQAHSMNETERAEFLAMFEKDANVTGFAVAGGVFSEAVDLAGEKLSAAMISGVCLPMVCAERELIRAFYDGEGKDGFAYAYIYPGMNKVLQAMGRVIRTEYDKGIAILLDERFEHFRYKSCFPSYYDNIEIISSQDALVRILDDVAKMLKK